MDIFHLDSIIPFKPMVRIRLQRTGRTKLPAYRVVIADSRNPRDGKFIEIIGHYSPLNDKEFVIKKDRYDHWLGQGAKPSTTIVRLVKKNA